MQGRGLRLSALLLVCYVFWLCQAGSAVRAAQSKPAAAPPIPTVIAATIDVPPYQPQQAGGSLPAIDGLGMAALAGKFAVVLVLLLVTLRILRAISPRLQGGGRPGAMVLHSEPLGDKQRVCLLDLQRQLVLVAVSGSGVTPLTSVENPEQVAALRARYGPAGTPGSPGLVPAPRASFAETLAREAATGGPVEPQDVAWAGPVAEPAAGQGDLRLGLALNSIRALRQRMDRS